MIFKTQCAHFAVIWLRGDPPEEPYVSSVPVELLASRRHLILAAHRACRAMKEGVSISRHFRYEMLACVTGIREISKLKGMRGNRWVAIKMCDSLEECLSWLVRQLSKHELIGEVYGLTGRSLCTDHHDVDAMERGALLELDR